MPKVTEEHRVARRSQILDAARRQFAANGFHMTSMDDVIAASGLSAGALYRYFPSKEVLIAETIDDALENMTAVVRHIAEQAVDATPGQAVEKLLTALLEKLAGEGETDITRIAIYAWAEAPRNPAVLEALASRYVGFRRILRDVAMRWLHSDTTTGNGTTEEADAIAKTMMAAVMGFIVQRTILGDVVPSDIRIGFDAVQTSRPLS